MGYRCPVCDDPQADDVHLANHLAFTALVRGGDHEAWLDEHVPEWEQLDDTGLADAVTELADDAAYPQVFEDTTDQHSHDHQHDLDRQHDHQHSHDHGHDHQHSHGHDHQHSHGYDTDSPQIPTVSDTGQLDEEAREILREAQELTRERRERDSTDDSSKEGAGAESSSEPDAETELDTDTNSSADN